MRKRSKAACVPVAVAMLVAAGCGSDEEPAAPKPPRIPAATAAELASISERIATDLDAGSLCTAAQRADQLSDAVERARLPERFREVEEVATTLVDTVNCPPPPEPEKKKKKEEGDEEKGEENGGSGPGDGDDYESAVLGGLPPGQAKKIRGD